MLTSGEVIKPHRSWTCLWNILDTRANSVAPKTIEPLHVCRTPITDNWGDTLLEDRSKLFEAVFTPETVRVNTSCQIAALAGLPQRQRQCVKHAVVS